jgi:phage gpG-like protein
MRIAFDKAGKWRQIKNRMLHELSQPDSKHISNINNIVVGKMISRTKSGVDVAGMKFTPYKAAYAKKKGYSTRDLTLTGQMLSRGSFKYQTIFQDGRIMIRIWMEGQHSGGVSMGTLASVHNFGMRSGRGAGFKMPKAEFFGIDAEITKAIKELSDEKWREIKRSLGL